MSPLIVRDEWPRWLEAAGCSNVRFGNEISCDLLYPSFQAAIEGLEVEKTMLGAAKRVVELAKGSG